MAGHIKVMIVDDSAVVRQVVTQTLESEPDIDVIAAVPDPLFALERLRRDWPDVIILDIEMPRMDGITFLKHVMSTKPTPVVICSSLAVKDSRMAFDAMAAGAVAVITKPKMALKAFLVDAANDIVQSVRAAAAANMRVLAPINPPPIMADEPVFSASTPVNLGRTTEQLIAIGTSTGGTQALEAILTRLPATCAGIVIVQHMPEKFTAMFAERLNSLCELEVREAQHGDRILPGVALIAPGGMHMSVKRSGAQYLVEVMDGPLVNRHKPSVDILFRSVAKWAGINALGIIMTGMGDDGARGLKEMRDAGAKTIAQDEASCVVFGMPKEAIKLGAADQVLPLSLVPRAILDFSR